MAEDLNNSKIDTKSVMGENVVLVGKKPAMNYVLAVVTQFNSGAKNVKVRARGNAISRAVDVAEITRHKFVTEAKVGLIEINSEELSNEDGTRSKVSSIEITLNK